MQVEDGIGERAIGPQSVLDDHRRLFEHLLGGEGTGTATIGLGEELFPFRPRILPDHRLEELHRLLEPLLLQRLGSPRGQGAKRGGRHRAALVGLLHSSVLPLARAVEWKVHDRKSRVAACGGWRDWACATRFVSRRRGKAQGTRYYGRRAQIGNAVRISPFQGFVEAAKALQKCRQLCPSGWARRRSRGLRLRHLHESSSFGAAVHRASKARTARIGIVKSRYQSTKRRPQLEGLLSGGAACPAARS